MNSVEKGIPGSLVDARVRAEFVEEGGNGCQLHIIENAVEVVGSLRFLSSSPLRPISWIYPRWMVEAWERPMSQTVLEPEVVLSNPGLELDKLQGIERPRSFQKTNSIKEVVEG
eukprot:scaffold2991_cov403-Prasinococcus_capsulatus_cf.AAC.18